jgi:hypothetical protein
MIRRNPERRRRFRPGMLIFLAGLIAAAVLYLRCGEGLGFGPGGGFGGGGDSKGEGEGDGDAKDQASRDEDKDKDAPDVRPAVGGGASAKRRCKLRLDASGLAVDDRTASVEEAVEACKRAGSAELTVTGDATFGEHQRVKKALDKAGVEVFERKRD